MSKEVDHYHHAGEDPRTKPFADAYNVPDDGDEYMFALPETQESTEGGSQSPVEEVKATDIRRQLVEASRVDEVGYRYLLSPCSSHNGIYRMTNLCLILRIYPI